MNALSVFPAIVAALLALIIYRQRQRKAAKAPQPQEAADFPPTPKWKPNVPVDIPRTVTTFAYYSNRQKPFVVFAHGTCVPVANDSANPEQEARKLLDGVFHSHPDFRSQQMDDGNWSVIYSGVACSVVFQDEYAKNLRSEEHTSELQSPVHLV